MAAQEEPLPWGAALQVWWPEGSSPRQALEQEPRSVRGGQASEEAQEGRQVSSLNQESPAGVASL